ncbi:MAG: hypothetical protein ACI8VT_001278 [Saprospiraceae bacterium]|jgi:hypothetical protein
MKKIVVLGAFFTFLCTMLFGQSEFRFGIQFSPTLTWINSADKIINSNGSAFGGPKLGMVGEKYFQENYAITFGLGFAFNQGGVLLHDYGGDLWKNSTLSNSIYHELPDGVNLRYSLQYVEIPLGLKMKTQEFGYIRYFAEIPIFTLGILTQAQGAIEGTDMNTDKENIREDVNLFSLSWGIGAGIEYSVGPNTSIIGGIYYQNYFTDISKNDGLRRGPGDGPEAPPTNKEDSKAALQGLTLRLGVMF